MLNYQNLLLSMVSDSMVHNYLWGKILFYFQRWKFCEFSCFLSVEIICIYIKTMTIYFSYTMGLLIREVNFSKGVVSTDVLFPRNSAQLLPFQSFLILLQHATGSSVKFHCFEHFSQLRLHFAIVIYWNFYLEACK